MPTGPGITSQVGSIDPRVNAGGINSELAASGKVLAADGASGVTWATVTGGSGSPGGADTQLQYNNSGSFAGTSGGTATATQITLVAPVLGAATATSINKVAITAPATSATLIIPDGVTMTGPPTSATVATLGLAETFTGVKTIGNAADVKLQFWNTHAYVEATADGALNIDAVTSVTVGATAGISNFGKLGDIVLCTGAVTTYYMYSAVDAKVMLGKSSYGFGGLYLSDGANVNVGTTTGTIFGQAGSKIGFLGKAPIAQLGAYTQTYSTASRTVPAATASNPPAGGTGTAAGGYDTAGNRDLMITSLTNCIADVLALKKVVNSLINDLGSGAGTGFGFHA